MAEMEDELRSFIREEFAKQTESLGGFALALSALRLLKGLSLEIAQLGVWCPEDMEAQGSKVAQSNSEAALRRCKRPLPCTRSPREHAPR